MHVGQAAPVVRQTQFVVCCCSALQSVAALAAALAQRNKELKDAREQIQMLNAQQQQQQAAADRHAQVERSRHSADLGRLEKEKEQHLKDALRLEVGFRLCRMHQVAPTSWKAKTTVSAMSHAQVGWSYV